MPRLKVEAPPTGLLRTGCQLPSALQGFLWFPVQIYCHICLFKCLFQLYLMPSCRFFEFPGPMDGNAWDLGWEFCPSPTVTMSRLFTALLLCCVTSTQDSKAEGERRPCGQESSASCVHRQMPGACRTMRKLDDVSRHRVKAGRKTPCHTARKCQVSAPSPTKYTLHLSGVRNAFKYLDITSCHGKSYLSSGFLLP